MSEHKITLAWKLETPEFTYKNYNRDHTWSFDGGIQVGASAAPAYFGNPALVDPEEALIAALSSCHMLTFLAVACKQKFIVESYTDEAVGTLEKDTDGKLAITQIILRPKINFGGENSPATEQLNEMHQFAHKECFIAHSIKARVTIES